MTTEAPVMLSESARVERWRSDALERAGYDEVSAATLAARPDVDLHRAIEMVEQGCPVDVAMKILV